jgi:hypothetical protein
MKGKNDLLVTALHSLPVGLTIGLLYNKFTTTQFLLSFGVGLIANAVGLSFLYSNLLICITLVVLVYAGKKEGFNTHTPPSQIANKLRKLKNSGNPLVEGFEDEKESKKNGQPAPVVTPMSDKETPQPFKLGEIPKQVKEGPHIDASATLMSAIKSLNPDQINAMTKDTKQLIETQKSLMSMLGTMKPMMNDGKELMETFNQMFGNQ